MSKSFRDSYFSVGDKKIHYLDNLVNSDSLLIVFPPGYFDARFVKNLHSLIPEEIRVISITYPSRYKSSRLFENNTLEEIASLIHAPIKELAERFKNVYIISFSFGTAISTLVASKKIPNLKENFLINAGEFFPVKLKNLLIKMFLPAINHKRLVRFYKYVLCDLIKLFPKHFFSGDHAYGLLEQWIDILKYKIPKLTINYKTTILEGNRDIIINRDSINKLRKIYLNCKIIYYPGSHLNYLNGFTNQEISLLRSIFIV